MKENHKMIVRCRVFVPYGCETVHCSWQRNRFFPWLKLSVTWLKIVPSLALSLILTTTFWPTKMAHDTEARMRCCTLPSPICEVRACSRNLFSDPATRNYFLIGWQLANSRQLYGWIKQKNLSCLPRYRCFNFLLLRNSYFPWVKTHQTLHKGHS